MLFVCSARVVLSISNVILCFLLSFMQFYVLFVLYAILCFVCPLCNFTICLSFMYFFVYHLGNSMLNCF